MRAAGVLVGKSLFIRNLYEITEDHAMITPMDDMTAALPPRLAAGRTAELFAWGDGRVLKLFNSDVSAGTADHEARLSELVHQSGLPTPAVFERIDMAGRAGIVYERIEGETMLAAFTRQPLSLLTWARTLAQLQYNIHQTASSGLSTIHQRLEQAIRRANPLSEHLRELALERLNRLPEGTVLLHGDFHPDNVLLSPQGVCIIDWIDAGQGHPLADVARSYLLMTGPLPPGLSAPQRLAMQAMRRAFVQKYLRHYFRLSGFDFKAMQEWLLPVAAARLAEQVPGDLERLLPLIEKG
jgi:aminoglycoside phosphotransferase (APT) family kinase protein